MKFSLLTLFALYSLQQKTMTFTTFDEQASKESNSILVLCLPIWGNGTAGDWLVGILPFCQCRFFVR